MNFYVLSSWGNHSALLCYCELYRETTERHTGIFHNDIQFIGDLKYMCAMTK
jgi:hypothetical protein